MRENKIDLKRIIKASKRVVFLKYKNEVIAFIIALMVLLYIEFFPNYHLPSLLDNSICNKINNLIYQLLLAYVASFIFFIVLNFFNNSSFFFGPIPSI